MTQALILIVEDNEHNMKLVRDVLGHAGYRTLEAGDAELGIELARTHRPDLILMDVQLPGMNGLEAIAQLRSDPVTTELRVVAVTAFAEAVIHLGRPLPAASCRLPGARRAASSLRSALHRVGLA